MLILVCLIPEVQGKIPKHFTNWPLHLTLAPWFELSGKELPGFLADVESIVASYAPLQLSQAGSATFSPSKVKVTLIKTTPEIIKLHQDLLFAIRNRHATLLSAIYTGSNYRPHITNQLNWNLPKDQVIYGNKLYLVARESANQRKVVYDKEFSKRSSGLSTTPQH